MRAPALALLAASALFATGMASASSAASLKLSDGATLFVSAPGLQLGGSNQARAPSESLRYSIAAPGGRTWTGSVPGSEGASSREVALAQNPVTGEIVMAFARPGRGGRDIVATGWTGQSWTEPREVAGGADDDRSPLLAFRPSGDALLAWTREGLMGASVLLRHFDASSGPELSTYSFVDVGSLQVLAGDMGATSGSAPVLLNVVGGVESLSAYLLVGTSERAPLSVVRVGLDAIFDPGGFGAAPVPVSFIRSAAQSASGGGLTGRAGESQAVGEILSPWRLVLGMGEAWYWVDSGRVQLATFAGGVTGRLMAFDDPGSDALLHVEAYRLVRAEFGSVLRRAGTPAGLETDRRRR